jgi:co-chaperonin GroES (HSP10)
MSKTKPVKGSIIAIKDRVFVTDMDDGENITKNGIIIPGDDRNARGIRDRWARVYLVGPDAADDLKVGDWILVKHGRWTPAVKIEDAVKGEIKVWLVEYPESVLVIADDIAEGDHPRDYAVTTSNATTY